MQSHVAAGVAGWEAIIATARTAPAALALDRFVFLRHGETARNFARIYQTADEPLNETGEAQARAAAAMLAGHNIGRLIASPMARAWRTANVVAEACRVRPEAEPDLRERLFTALWGTPVGTIDWAHDPVGCETLAEFVARVQRGARAAHDRHAGNRRGELLLVAHGGVLLALCAWLGVPVSEEMRGNAQPIHFERDAGSWRARLIGEAKAASAIT
jgi:probable phosphoglycerate mutase